jgi:UDPglucose 6-dehydrogenase
MKIGYVGAGKLGMPVAACVAQKHDVKLYDAVPSIHSRWGRYPFEESAKGTPYGSINELMHAVQGNVSIAHSMAEMRDRDIIFVAVQTPHDPAYEGVTPLGNLPPKDFDYSFLKDALTLLAEALKGSGRHHTVVVISTCLPGTYRREFEAISQGWVNINLVYNPYFIAMGTVIPDFLDPEFILVGAESATSVLDLRKFYESFGIADRARLMDITSAEATKVFYNTFISMKLSYANIVAEACERVGADCDHVMGAIKAANKRLISPAYLTPGMGDGGGCHPRDNIALSHFATEHGMSFDFFGMLMQQREAQAQHLADLLAGSASGNWRPAGIVGFAFKANTNIATGSHTVLVWEILKRQGLQASVYDRFINDQDPVTPGAYLIGCAHDYIKTLAFPKGSIVIDPWGIVQDQEGVEVRRLGRKSSPGKLEARAAA